MLLLKMQRNVAKNCGIPFSLIPYLRNMNGIFFHVVYKRDSFTYPVSVKKKGQGLRLWNGAQNFMQVKIRRNTFIDLQNFLRSVSCCVCCWAQL